MKQDDVTAILIGLTTFLLLWLTQLHSYMMFRLRCFRRLPPGPLSLPLVGCLFTFNTTDVQRTYRDLREKYGDVFSFRLGSKLYVVVSGYERIKEVLSKQGSTFSDRADSFFFKQIKNHKGIISSNGRIWQQQRRLFLSHFKHFGANTRRLEETIKYEIHQLISGIQMLNGMSFDPKGFISSTTSNIICTLAFAKRFPLSDLQNAESFANIFLRNQDFTQAVNYFPFLRLFPFDLSSTNVAMNAYYKVLKTIMTIFHEHKSKSTPEDPLDIIDRLLAEQVTNPIAFSDDEVVQTMFDIYVAGTDNPSSNIVWAIHFLVRYPDVQENMRREINTVLPIGDLPSMADKSVLHYCRATITEVLRYNGFIRVVTRAPTDDTTIAGYYVPKGTMTFFNLDSVHYDEKHYRNSNKFKPDRFLDDEGRFVGNERNLMFGLGQRKCPGQNLSEAELFLIVTSLVQNFRLEADDSYHSPLTESHIGISGQPPIFRICAIAVGKVDIYDYYAGRAKQLTAKLLQQGYDETRLKSTFRKFYGRHHELMDHYGMSMSQISLDWSGF